MRTKLVRIGNSRGVRLPKPLIEESDLSEEVELVAGDRTILIRSAVGPRASWAEAAAALARREGGLLDAPTPTHFDADWTW